MSAPAMTLEEIQRTMAAAVMMPLTADEDMRSHAPDGRSMVDVAASFVAPNSRLTAFERLEIYNRQYWLRVLGSLAQDFPVVRAVVGARFDDLLVAYLKEHPSRSFSLRNLGSKLPQWLAAHPKHPGRRHALAVDVATIEWAFVEAFDNEQRTPLTLDQIATLDANSRLGLQPHVQLMALEYPVDDLVIALHSREKRQTSEAGVTSEDDNEFANVRLPKIRPRQTWLAAHRVDNNVYYRRLDREEYAVLCALRDGQSLGVALNSGFAASRMSQARRAAAVQRWFTVWAELGWITAPDLEPLLNT